MPPCRARLPAIEGPNPRAAAMRCDPSGVTAPLAPQPQFANDASAMSTILCRCTSSFGEAPRFLSISFRTSLTKASSSAQVAGPYDSVPHRLSLALKFDDAPVRQRPKAPSSSNLLVGGRQVQRLLKKHDGVAGRAVGKDRVGLGRRHGDSMLLLAWQRRWIAPRVSKNTCRSPCRSSLQAQMPPDDRSE